MQHNMWFQISAYIQFLFSSNNQHGVHSPFVFNYVTKCLYAKPNFKTSKAINILLKSISYFKATQIYIDGDLSIKNKCTQKFKNLAFGQGPYDLVYTDSPKTDTLETYPVHNNSMILIDHIHKNREYTTNWEIVKNMEEVTVTLDLFYFGLLFFRKEQAKEHFKIRI